MRSETSLTTTKHQGMTAEPPAQTRQIAISLEALLSNCERSSDGKRWEISESRWTAPGISRQALFDRRSEIERAMARAPERVVVALILEMFLRYSSAAGADDRAQRAAAYASDLSQFPAWAIAKAIEGRGASPFAPSSIELVDKARSAVQQFKAELIQINRVLNAETVRTQTESERQRVMEGFDAIRETLSILDDYESKRGREERLTAEAKEAVARMEAGERVTLPPMSPRLRAHFGLDGDR